MFDKFCDYMYYLLTSPFKRVKRALNQWYILFRVLGKRFDDAMESLYSAKEQTMLATCDQEMLSVHAEDRKMTRYAGENAENFRIRIANYPEILKLAGSNRGVILAVKTLGYETVGIKTAKELKEDSGRWAEFYVLIRLEAGQAFPIPFFILRKEVRIWKEVGAKDNYQFIIQYTDQTNKVKDICRTAIGLSCRGQENVGICSVFRMEAENKICSGFIINIKNDLWYLNGEYKLDGEKLLDAYERKVEML